MDYHGNIAIWLYGLIGFMCNKWGDWVSGVDWIPNTNVMTVMTKAPVMLKNQSNICAPGYEPD